MSNNPFAGLPNNKFGNAFDLSSLKAPSPADLPTYGKVVTQTNLVAEFVKESNNQVVVLLCWSPRSAQAKEILEILGKLETADKNTWLLGTVNVDTEAAVAQALQVQSVPVAIAIIQEQIIPLFESVPPIDQVRLVINKLLELAAGKGIGSAPENTGPVEIPMEPEEEAAYAAMEKGDYAAAKASYQAWLNSSSYAPGGGESYDEASIRIEEALEKLVAEYPGKKIIVVTHNGVIKIAAKIAVGGPNDAVFHMDATPCSISSVSIWPSDGLRALRSFNERGHLR